MTNVTDGIAFKKKRGLCKTTFSYKSRREENLSVGSYSENVE